MPDQWFDNFLALAKQFGLTRALFVAFFFMAHYWLYKQYMGRLEDRQKEIDRLAVDNRDYRERFMVLFDKSFSVSRKSVVGSGKNTTTQDEE